MVVRKLAFTGVGVFLFATGLTLMYLAMRAVMDVGGYCASGGPYEIRQECPDGIWLMFAGIFAGLVGTGLVVAGTFPRGPKLWVLAWPALFCALGWNFLEYGFDPPPPEDGLVWGWLVCGVIFVLMGAIPLLFVLANARSVLWGQGGQPAAAAAPSASASRFVRVGPTPGAATEPSRASAGPPDADGDLVSDLERLAALHRRGQLTDDEYARAKDARLDEAGT